MQTKDFPFVQRVAILLELPDLQDNEKEYATMTQAYTDLSYGVDVDPDLMQTINAKLDQFNI